MSKTPLKVIGAIVLAAGAGVATYFTLDLLQAKPVQSSQSQTSESSSTSSTTESATEDLENTSPATSQDQTTEVSEETNQQNLITKNIVSSIVSGLNNYQANNRGTMPTTEETTDQFVTDYLSQVTLMNPKTSTPYQVSLNAAATENTISYQPGYTCSVDTDPITPIEGTSRQFAVSVILPDATLYCSGN